MYNPQEVEKEILAYWKKKNIFSKLQRKNKGKKPWSFIDGPITANNPMGVHHAWGRTYKDVFQRYHAMQGFSQRYQNGFDCQGLWVEVEVEKSLGFNSRREIEQYGLAKFARACRARVMKYAKVQTEQSIALGQWMDWDRSYYTMDDDNIEHIWYFLKKCYQRGWLYKGSSVLPWCVRCGTALSHHELIDSYTETTHPGVFIQIPVKGRKQTYLLVWTTTSWTLPGNVAVAVHPGNEYVETQQGKITYILGAENLSVLKGQYTIRKRIRGDELIGLTYVTPFSALAIQEGIQHKVIAWKEVGTDGTGLVHIAPSCGAEDFFLARNEMLVIPPTPLDEEGRYVEGYGWLSGISVRKVHDRIVDDLKKNGFLYAVEEYRHRYPVCWRCKEELVFRLESAWYISSKEVRSLMMKAVKKVQWYPAHGGALMQDWLIHMQDWNISRRRYWGLPLMFYECGCGHLEVVGTRNELRRKAVEKKKVDNLPELHRPWIDSIQITCPKCKRSVDRIPDVGDCWLDAGIVPFSTLSYLQNKQYWKKWFPAHFITEMREQIRLWFYSMLFMSVTLEQTAPYLRVLVHEKVHDEKGQPMHKSLGNAIWFDDAVKKMGADVMRHLYLQQNPQQNINFGFGPAQEAKRTLDVIWNLGKYVQLYCRSRKRLTGLQLTDTWILSRRETTKLRVAQYMKQLEIHRAMAEVGSYLTNDLSRGYVQMIRHRIDEPVVQCVLLQCYQEGLCMLAPFLPFLSEKLYQEIQPKYESIHLCDWPKISRRYIRTEIEKGMDYARATMQHILSERESHGLGIRWPLSKVTITSPHVLKMKPFSSVIEQQTNIKSVILRKGEDRIELDVTLTPALEKEGITREILRRVQHLRKTAGLQPHDRIELKISSETDFQMDDILRKVNAIMMTGKPQIEKSFTLRNFTVTISLRKVI